MEKVPRRTSRAPFASSVFVLILIGLETKTFRIPGATRDHFCCTVEPSRGQCRLSGWRHPCFLVSCVFLSPAQKGPF